MIFLTRRTMLTSSLALLAGCATQTATDTGTAPAPARPAAAIGAWGIDLTAMDTSVKPGNDFYRYANGAWIDRTEIPADRTNWGTFTILAEKAERDVKAIIDETVAAHPAAGSDEQKIADLFSSYADQAAIDAAGLTPAQADLAAINALRNHEDVARLVGRPDMPVDFPIGVYIDLDPRNPDRFIVHMTHAGLSLPDREYYLNADAQFEQTRQAFKAHVARMFTAAGISGGAI